MKKLTRTEASFTKEIIDLWESRELPSQRNKLLFSRIGDRLYTLLESGVLLPAIRAAIENYSNSRWHRDNNRFVNLHKFLSVEYIDKWKKPPMPPMKKNDEMMWALGERL